MTGYEVVFDGDEQSEYSAYSPDLRGSWGQSTHAKRPRPSRSHGGHIAIPRQTGQPVPESVAAVIIVGIPTA
jgi:hypothetical protein